MLIGTLGSVARARIGGGGELTRADGISVEWWAGADDRWHIPSAEITSRQSLVGNAPMVRTAVRVPGGDAVSTTYAVHQARRDLVVTQLENQSRLPFAVAVVVRGARDIALRGTVLSAGGVPVVTFERPPQLVCTVPAGGDVLTALKSRAAEKPGESGSMSAAGTAPDGALAGPGEPRDVAVLLPLAHSASLRWVTGIAADPLAGPPVLSALAEAESVVRGWDAQVERATALTLGDPGLVDGYDAALRALLLRADAEGLRNPPDPVAEADLFADRVVLAYALARAGLGAEASRLLVPLASQQGLRGELGEPWVTATAAAAICLGGDPSLAAVAAGALEHIGRRAKRDAAQRPYAAVLALGSATFTAWNEHGASAASAGAWRDLGSPWPLPGWPVLPLPARAAGATLVPDDDRRLAATVVRTLDAVAAWRPDGRDRDRGSRKHSHDRGCVELLAGLSETWRGVPVEARSVVIPGGVLSFAVRWHGTNPAVLWEASGELTLSCSAIDAGWRATGQRGETLITA